MNFNYADLMSLGRKYILNRWKSLDYGESVFVLKTQEQVDNFDLNKNISSYVLVDASEPICIPDTYHSKLRVYSKDYFISIGGTTVVYADGNTKINAFNNSVVLSRDDVRLNLYDNSTSLGLMDSGSRAYYCNKVLDQSYFHYYPEEIERKEEITVASYGLTNFYTEEGDLFFEVKRRIQNVISSGRIPLSYDLIWPMEF